MEGAEPIISTVIVESPREISAEHRPREEGGEENTAWDEGEVYSDGEFEFALVPWDADTGADATADEIFSNGRIRPAYPVFGRDLPHEGAGAGKAVRAPLQKLAAWDRDVSATSSECDELEGVPEQSYCAWAPRSVPQSPDRCRKSSSTGSAGRGWRLLDLMVGRSRSDGKERFVFLGSPERENISNAKPSAEAKKEDGKKKKKTTKGAKVTEADVVTVHRAYYAKVAQGAKGGRRSYLPYRPELVGFFGGGIGPGRTHHPF